jgi:REP element-mobilizing transposase RayT
MRYDPQHHHRRSIRLQEYDYGQVGVYFITICTRDRVCLFGEVVDGQLRLNAAGRFVETCWEGIPDHFPNVELDAFVVMPNHVHGLIVITPHDVGARLDGAGSRSDGVGARHAVPLPGTEQFGKPVSGSVPTIVRSFKSAVTKRIRQMVGDPEAIIWQRNYYEHIVRDAASLNHIRQYIRENPVRWAADREHQMTPLPALL